MLVVAETAVEDFVILAVDVAVVVAMRKRRIPQSLVLPEGFPHIVQNSSCGLQGQGLR